MFALGRRTLEIGVICVALVLIVSVSCAMSKACPSGFYPVSSSESDPGANMLDGSGMDGLNNIIPVDEDRKKEQELAEVFNKDVVITPTTTTTSTTSTESTTASSSLLKEPFSVVISTATNHAGRSMVVNFTTKECQNLPEIMRNRVNSINTNSKCVILCDLLDCGGWCIQFAPGTPSHHRFRKLRFHNRAESAIACDEEE